MNTKLGNARSTNKSFKQQNIQAKYYSRASSRLTNDTISLFLCKKWRDEDKTWHNRSKQTNHASTIIPRATRGEIRPREYRKRTISKLVLLLL